MANTNFSCINVIEKSTVLRKMNVSFIVHSCLGKYSSSLDNCWKSPNIVTPWSKIPILIWAFYVLVLFIQFYLETCALSEHSFAQGQDYGVSRENQSSLTSEDWNQLFTRNHPSKYWTGLSLLNLLFTKPCFV